MAGHQIEVVGIGHVILRSPARAPEADDRIVIGESTLEFTVPGPLCNHFTFAIDHGTQPSPNLFFSITISFLYSKHLDNLNQFHYPNRTVTHNLLAKTYPTLRISPLTNVMPTTRRSTAARGTRGQSTISFQNKITKPLPSHAKKANVTTTAATKAKLPASPSVEPDVVDIDLEKEDEQVEVKTEPQVPTQSEAELKAAKITDAHIKKYWKSIEENRIAPRVHQGDLSQSEKILRYFDVSSQYGVSAIPFIV